MARKAIVISTVVALVVVLGWVGVLVAMQKWARGDGPTFRGETEALLIALGDEDRVEQVYDDASPRFREMVIRERFEEMIEDMNATLGGFREITAVKETELISGSTGRTGRLHARVRFEKGETLGNFSYHEIDGAWRLLGISVDLPEGASLPRPTGEALRAKIEAPQEVVELMRSSLRRAHAGEAGEVWDEAAEPFRTSIEREKFIALVDNRQQAMGGFIRVLDLIQSRQHPNKNKSTIIAALEYGDARTTGTFDFVRVDDQWQVYGFKIIVPEPLVPEMPTEAPAETD